MPCQYLEDFLGSFFRMSANAAIITTSSYLPEVWAHRVRKPGEEAPARAPCCFLVRSGEDTGAEAAVDAATAEPVNTRLASAQCARQLRLLTVTAVR